MKHVSETAILKRYSQPPGDPPDNTKQETSGSISVFPSSPLDMPPETFKNALKRREENHQVLIQWIKKNLKPDIDYGRSHIEENCKYARAGVSHLCSDFTHMSMITLWKSGAEKILRLLGLSVHFPNVHQYELGAVHRQEIQTVILKCELRTSNGTVVAEGTGARHVNQDGWNLNKSIKMTSKSAMVDATIRVAGLSGIFIKTHRNTLTKLGACNADNRPGTGACNADNRPGTGACNGHNNQQKLTQPQLITQPQKDLILKLAGRLGLTIEALDKRCKDTFGGVLKGLERHCASRLISQLNGQF